MMYTYTLELLI